MLSPEYLSILRKTADTSQIQRIRNTSRKREQLLTLMNSDVLVNSHTTLMFRNDIDWNHLGEMIKERYKDEDKVNVHIYACSSGEEAYTTSILLQEKLGKDANKFFPIEAKDISKSCIESAKKLQALGKVPVHKNSLKKGAVSLHTTAKGMSKYIECKKGEHNDYIREAALKPVQFSCADILKDIDTIDPKTPAIVMCRNMWPYVKDSEYWNFAKNLYEKLAPNSMVIVGEFDNDTAPEILWALGYYFKQDGLIFLKD